MSHSENDHGDVIDRLVRAYVEREIEAVDASALVARTLATARTVPAAPSNHLVSLAASRQKAGRRLSRSATWVGVSAAAVLLAFVGGQHFDLRSARAAVVLRNVHSEHRLPVDRCYRVQFAPDPRFWDSQNKLEGPSTSVLWSRGDRFWARCSIADLHFTLGRDPNGFFWFSPSPAEGMQFTNLESQLPKKLAVICAVSSMNVTKLVDDVLADFDLHADPFTANAADATMLIWAKLQPGRSHPLLSDALMEVDPLTNVLRRLVLWTTRDGRPSGTVTYTLLESGRQSDDQYFLRSHLDDDAKIQPRTLPAPEQELLFDE